ncbi:MAG: hypothetical protein RSH07_15400, partial [Comamonas sp.]
RGRRFAVHGSVAGSEIGACCTPLMLKQGDSGVRPWNQIYEQSGIAATLVSYKRLNILIN